jgi:anti-sigma regulatory factor (Ser/Thr protein kinase)
MGKGLSASVTAIQSSSFINHSVELSIIKDDFDMNKMLSSFLHYIKDRLLDEEALCAAFASLDSNTNTINIANFGMPPLLMQNSKGEIIKIANNNLPIMRCVAGRTFRSYSLKNIEKILMMSDGLIEAATKDENLYMDYIDDHFKASLTKKHFLNMVNKTIDSNDDDITFFMFKKACMREFQGQEIVVNTSLDAINDAMQWASDRMDEDQISDIDRSSIEFALTEILMNALEHGNLGIGFNEKQELIATGEYDSYILEHTKEDSPQYTKKISLKYQLKTNLSDDFWLLVLSITDEGNGFTPSNIFKYHSFDGNLCQIDSKSYNGRGIFITDNMVDGLYYNENGNVANIVKVIPAQKK